MFGTMYPMWNKVHFTPFINFYQAVNERLLKRVDMTKMCPLSSVVILIDISGLHSLFRLIFINLLNEIVLHPNQLT